MSTIDTQQALPPGPGAWTRSTPTIGFAIDYMAGTFHGSFADYDAQVTDGALEGSAAVASVQAKDPNLEAHLQGPDFFDAERNPQLAFRTKHISRSGNDLTIAGELTIKGHTEPVEIKGVDQRPDPRPLRRRALRAQARDDAGPHRVRRELEQPAAERRAGPVERRKAGRGPAARADGGLTDARPRHQREPAPRLAQHEAADGGGAVARGEGVELVLYDGLREVPPYDEDDDRDPAPAAVAHLRDAIAGADAVIFSTPEYNHSIPGQLKNAVDWASRPLATNVFRNKPGIEWLYSGVEKTTASAPLWRRAVARALREPGRVVVLVIRRDLSDACIDTSSRRSPRATAPPKSAAGVVRVATQAPADAEACSRPSARAAGPRPASRRWTGRLAISAAVSSSRRTRCRA